MDNPFKKKQKFLSYEETGINCEDKSNAPKEEIRLAFQAIEQCNVEQLRRIIANWTPEQINNASIEEVRQRRPTFQPRDAQDRLQQLIMNMQLQSTVKKKLFLTACEVGYYDVVQLLLESGAEVNMKDVSGQTPLHQACKDGHERMVRLLLKSGGVEVNVQDTCRQTPLHWACQAENYTAVELLLESGAEVNIQDTSGETPLHQACKAENYKVVELLLKSGAEVNIQDIFSKTPLHWACKEGNYKAVELLLESEAEVNVQDTSGETPLHQACKAENYQAVELLLESEAEVNVQDTSGETPLHQACKDGNEEIVQLLLKSGGAEVNVQDARRQTPLHQACQAGNYKVVQLLLKSGAKVNVRDIYRQTPLYWPCKEGNYKAVELLLKSGAKVNIGDSINDISLHGADSYKIKKLFLKERGVMLPGDTKQLSQACEEQDLEQVALLIKHGVVPDENDISPIINMMEVEIAKNNLEYIPFLIIFLSEKWYSKQKLQQHSEQKLTQIIGVLPKEFFLKFHKEYFQYFLSNYYSPACVLEKYTDRKKYQEIEARIMAIDPLKSKLKKYSIKQEKLNFLCDHLKKEQLEVMEPLIETSQLECDEIVNLECSNTDKIKQIRKLCLNTCLANMLREFYCALLLHLNPDFDDDLLQDSLEMLSPPRLEHELAFEPYCKSNLEKYHSLIAEQSFEKRIQYSINILLDLADMLSEKQYSPYKQNEEKILDIIKKQNSFDSESSDSDSSDSESSKTEKDPYKFLLKSRPADKEIIGPSICIDAQKNFGK